MISYCTHCGDEFHPVEYRPASADPDEPRFCSDECEDESSSEDDMTDAYYEARYGAAQVF